MSRLRLPTTAGLALILSLGCLVTGARAQEPGLCTSASSADLTLIGRVVDDASGVALPGATVAARWIGAAGTDLEATTRAEPDGFYRFCRVPLGVPITLQASFRTRATEPVTARLESPPVAYDFRVPAGDEAGVAVRETPRAGPARVVGSARDAESSRPIEDAVITLRPIRSPGSEGQQPGVEEEPKPLQALTDAQGRFVMTDVAPGTHYALELRHVAYGAVREPIWVPANRTLEVDLRVPPTAIEMEPIVVKAIRDRRLEIKGFYQRRDWGERLGLGHYFHREDIERRQPALITHMVDDVPGVRLECRFSHRARTCDPTSTRNPLSCWRMNVYVDGILVLDGMQRPSSAEMHLDEFVNPAEVGGIEVYPSSSSIAAEFGGSTGQCGAVVIWTRGGG